MASSLKVSSAQVKLGLNVNFFFNSLSINLKKTRESQQDNNKPLLCKQKFFKSKVYYHSFLSAFEIILNEIQATV